MSRLSHGWPVLLMFVRSFSTSSRPNCGLAAITCSKLGRSYSTYYLIARHFKLPIRFMNNINQIDLTTRDSCLSHSDYSPVPR
jgi:hypothetical protein